MAKPSTSPIAAYQKAVQLFQSRQPAAARKLLRDIVDRHPDAVPALQLIGIVCCDLGKPEEGIRHLTRAVRLEPRSASARSNLGKAQLLAGKPTEALASFRAGLVIAPTATPLLCGCGNALGALGALAEAAEMYARALGVDPNCVEAHDNLGRLRARQGRWGDAATSLQRAVALDAANAEAWLGLAEALRKSNRPGEGFEAFERGLALRPATETGLVSALQGMQDFASWRDFDATRKAVIETANAEKASIAPFLLLQISDDPEVHLRAARTSMRRNPPVAEPLPPRKPAAPGHRIRLAYVSGDFREHPTSRLMVGHYEAHDRSQFEVIGAAIGRERDTGDFARRFSAAFDRVVDLTREPDAAVVVALRDLEVDIAIDVMGHTDYARPGVFKSRLAPLQVTYLSYPGTTGLAEMDYIVLDQTLATPRVRRALAEQPIVLPGCYQVTDGARTPPSAPRTRTAYGLPEQGFVYCCLNNPQKISPEMFAVWMRILRNAPGSVLWLLESNPIANANLRAEAIRHGIAAERLVFGPRLPQAEHLARYHVADLFLDTFPYGAHTTASDAMWVGCPVLTRVGNSFPSRVGASLLRAVGLTELICDDLEAYETKAVVLARAPESHAMLRQSLATARSTSPLYDTKAFTRQFESALATIWQRHLEGQRPSPLVLPDPDRE
jgi:predicted O-linked N-acetylglucosamine transferase (SPINDLY family)